MDVTANGVRYHVEVINETKQPTIVFLHGFTGSTNTWRPVVEKFHNFKIVLIDLIGHGKSESPESWERYTMEQQIADLDTVFTKLALTDITLAGYSMGGRTALAYACTFPERLHTLILESASPGLQTEEEQKKRRDSDAALATRIVKDGLPAFIDFWENIPLFGSQNKLQAPVKQALRQERLGQNPDGLANSLRGMGTGSQISYWEALEGLQIPVLLVVGSLDLKFEGIGKAMLALIPDARLEIVEAGHAIHVEKPLEFATMVEEYLTLEI
ncbi:2-succinyl-6-hydroxy-2,4-cyclohexadiene-1-carboxylate synthase [Planomicrobium soli]|uniref:Putative 2-succinyl-6-hydroxy-2,4-cyclohexadiene-1-carboxylate synthase n=1 Tax=Planomicrobium soli TaxID=1176648 RepID=A0A2P8GAY4_9BACL|nr:2-succinyl-6-hydroxy-2,4-cyclohexadiene-1-carboxylate synthase [Planomicrobium soli]PSL31131.1 2-succinyl-6-hydroxy-2,4-cyclohexadiene-1-carboxylate synthase [Planomicrobium soli]